MLSGEESHQDPEAQTVGPRTDVLLIQESHGCQEDADQLSLVISSHQFWCSCGVNPTAGGVVIGLSRQTYNVDAICDDDVEILDPGRILAIVAKRMPDGAAAVCFLTVHVQPDLLKRERIAFFRKICDYERRHPGALLIMGGDFNSLPEDEFVFQVQTSRLTPCHPGAAKDFASILGWSEIFQEDYTRVGRHTSDTDDVGEVRTLARLDRLYSNLNVVDLLDLRPSAATCASVLERFHISDHTAVRGSIDARRVEGGDPRIPP